MELKPQWVLIGISGLRMSYSNLKIIMMRNKALLILLMFMPFFLMSQTTEITMPDIPLDEEGNIRYIEVVNEDATSKDLFYRCVSWINKEFENPNSVTKKRDMVNGRIEIFHRFRVYNTLENGSKSAAGTVLYTLIIRFKDGRYRAEMTDFIIKRQIRTPANIWLDKTKIDYSPNYATQLDEFAKTKLESLKKGMMPEKVYQEEEW